MNRRDVIAARDVAKAFVKASDELLAITDRRWDSESQSYRSVPWTDTWTIAGKASGAHRRLSLDLTRALANMRRPS